MAQFYLAWFIFAAHFLGGFTIDYVKLECPEGFEANGHAWYGPKSNDYDSNTRGDATNVAIGHWDYNTVLNSSSTYNPQDYAVCIICTKSRYIKDAPQLEIEVCFTKSESRQDLQLHSEKRNCVQQYNRSFVDHYKTMTWCKDEPVCSIQVPENETNLYQTLFGIRALSCEPSKALPQENYPKQHKFKCPQKYDFVGLEQHHTMCNNETTSSFCLLCQSPKIKYSICIPQNCPQIANTVNIKQLLVENSECKLQEDNTNKRFCNSNPSSPELFCSYNLEYVNVSNVRFEMNYSDDCEALYENPGNTGSPSGSRTKTTEYKSIQNDQGSNVGLQSESSTKPIEYKSTNYHLGSNVGSASESSTKPIEYKSTYNDQGSNIDTTLVIERNDNATGRVSHYDCHTSHIDQLFTTLYVLFAVVGISTTINIILIIAVVMMKRSHDTYKKRNTKQRQTADNSRMEPEFEPYDELEEDIRSRVGRLNRDTPQNISYIYTEYAYPENSTKK